MKNVKLLLSVLGFTESVGLGTAELWAKDGILSSIRLEGTNYCHMHFPAIDEKTLYWDSPVLKDPKSGDVIHFYGRCDYDPHGKDAVWSQSLQNQRAERRDMD